FRLLLAQRVAGVVAQAVRVAVGLHGRGDRHAPVVLAGDVQVDVRRLAAVGADLGLDLLALVVEHIAEHDRRALGNEHAPFDRALSTGATADQRDLTVEPSHASLLARIRATEDWLSANRCTPRFPFRARTPAGIRPRRPTPARSPDSSPRRASSRA